MTLKRLKNMDEMQLFNDLLLLLLLLFIGWNVMLYNDRWIQWTDTIDWLASGKTVAYVPVSAQSASPLLSLILTVLKGSEEQ